MALTYEDLEGRWLAVDSTCASHVYLYDDDLLVKFKESGAVYVYYGAGQEIFALLRASSVGIFINTQIKPAYHGELLKNPPPMQRSGGYDQRY